MLKIHEESAANGELSAVFLRIREQALELVSGEAVLALPEEALPAVMARFGAPFDPQARVTVVATLELGSGRVLRHVRHLAGYDVIARDYLVYETLEHEPRCALSTAVSAALIHLGRAHAQARAAELG